MNFSDFIFQGGRVKTQSGANVANIKLNSGDTEYVLSGTVEWKSGFASIHRWTVDGIVENLPLNHGLNICPTIPHTVYNMVDIELLNKYSNISEFYRNEK